MKKIIVMLCVPLLFGLTACTEEDVYWFWDTLLYGEPEPVYVAPQPVYVTPAPPPPPQTTVIVTPPPPKTVVVRPAPP
ncbi:MAG: hypothetical protein J6Q65_04610, partial [Lentisphaeria bacterium]|nr:hypothetical protein [Lentisphaeria bacterium]